MKLLKYSFLVTILMISGCIYGDLDDIYKKDIKLKVEKYCNDKNNKQCSRYSDCFIDTYSKIPGLADLSTVTYISQLSRCDKGNERNNYEDSKCLMDAASAKMELFKSNNNPVYMKYAYILYVHNSCASISDDKIYDMDRYNSIIEKEIESKGNEL
ncbi:hypothetical protein [Citrobacter telavivensis]